MESSTLQKPPRRYSVLVSDDDAETRQTLGDVLSSDGFATFLASCGGEALDIFQRELIDLLVMDMFMPDLTGLETLQMIRRISTRRVPCIFVTGRAEDEELRRQAMLADAFTVLPKPISVNLVRAAVRLVLKRYC
jgi:CheY-like chemotaxis protein